MQKQEILIREYETITDQIIHWDKFFWQKSQFFLAIESVLLAGVSLRLSVEFSRAEPISDHDFVLFIVLFIFNLYLCYTWFRTSRSNREYLRVRFARALQIEQDPAMKGILKLYTYQDEMLNQPQYKKHGSNRWELHIPTIFALAWTATLVAANFDHPSCLHALASGVVSFIAVIILLVVEITGWPTPTRGWLQT